MLHRSWLVKVWCNSGREGEAADRALISNQNSVMASSNKDSKEVISQEAVPSASTTDSTGPCAGRNCVPAQATLDGNDADAGDLTWWQSESDPKCNDVWFNFNWTDEGARKVVDYRVIYGPLGDRLQGDRPIVTIDTTNAGVKTLAYDDVLSCSTSTFNDTVNLVRDDRCVMKTDVVDAVGMRFTWKLKPVDGACQINIEEFIIHAEPNPISQPVKSGLSAGIIAAIVVPIVVIAGAVGTLLVIRQRNLKRRQQTGRV
ncbi:hypothetical protein HDU67_003773 [Dinochytrium kinnereticum]|nr:hypothetical protein HDU67_003773 [Dinochytrium kinnereticum]